tara:strand:+ start:104 stop:1234 length:1131 start_codon:yes stop_codon:yes gene_type:complete
MKKIGIIGAGISGLYLANILNNHSEFDYKIFEKRDGFDVKEGYGIQLSVNSIKLLNKIGFKNLPASEVCFPNKVNFFQSNNSKKICDIDLTRFNDDQNRYTTLRRSTLLKFLIENIHKDKIKFNTRLTHLKEDNKIEAHFSDNSEESFDFLVIADGIFSQSRSIVLNQVIEPKYNNSIAIRGLISDYNDNNISVFMGSNFHYVIYPINQNNEYNFVAIIKKKLAEDEIKNHQLFQNEDFLSSMKVFLAKNSNMSFENLIKVKAFPVFFNNEVKSINKKNIFLSGDALFALPPSFAQGASQSIETAQDIFKSILNDSDDFYKKRIRKISSINWKSRLNHFAFHLSNPLNVIIRNLILGYLTKNKKFLENYLGKIYRN